MTTVSKPPEERYAKGLTWRSAFALLFSLFVVQPIMVYFNLISNMTLPLQTWITIVLWAEMSRFLGTKMTKQELFILLTFQSMAIWYSLIFLTPIRNMYNAASEPARILGIAQYVPDWWAPRGLALEEVFESQYVFFHPAWVKIIGIMLASLLFGLTADLILGYFLYMLFVRIEQLNFPSARAQVETVLTLADRPPDKMRAVLVSALGGIIFNIVVKFVPFTLGTFLYGGMIAYWYSLPMVDLTYLLDYILPGASLAFATDIIFYVSGFLLPIPIAVAQFLGAFGFYFIGTHLITRLNLWPPESRWVTGWGYLRLTERAQLYFYTSAAIGLSLAALIMPILLSPRPFLRAFASLKSGLERVNGKGGLSVYTLLGVFLASSLGLVFLAWSLTDFQFPVWILLLTITGGSFFATYLSTASLGVTFTGFPTIPYLREMSIYYSGYGGREIWFAPFTVSTGGATVAQTLLQADVCEVRHREYFTTYIVLVLLGLLSSFVFVTLFWNISPIPSSAYPATITSWPVDALTWSRTQVWIWSGYLFRTNWMMIGFAIGAIVYAVSFFVLRAPYILISMITGIFLGVPYSPIGIFVPIYSPIGIAFAQLIGSIISQRMVVRIFKEKWRVYCPLVVMGAIIGDGFMELLRAIMILVVRSSWLLPY